MKYILKILLITLLVFGMVSAYVEGVSAEEVISTPTEGIESKEANSGYGSINLNKKGEIGILANNYLKDGFSRIFSNGSTVEVSGSTMATTAVQTIVVELYLQQWDSYRAQWKDIRNVGEFRNSYSSIVHGSKDYIVIPGYKYRTRAHHWVNHRGLIDNEFSYSSYITVK